MSVVVKRSKYLLSVLQCIITYLLLNMPLHSIVTVIKYSKTECHTVNKSCPASYLTFNGVQSTQQTTIVNNRSECHTQMTTTPVR